MTLLDTLKEAYLGWLARELANRLPPRTPLVSLDYEGISMATATATYKVTITGSAPGALHHATFLIDGAAQPVIDIVDQQSFNFPQGSKVGLSVMDDLGGVLAPAPAVVGEFTVPTAPPPAVPTPTVTLDFVAFNPPA